MEYYALQIQTRLEERFISLFEVRYPQLDVTLSFPQRVVLEHRSGRKPLRREKPLFPGYVFAAISGKTQRQFCLDSLRATPHFCRFLPSNTEIVPLGGRSLEIVLHFIRGGGTAGISRVYFNGDERIVVSEGPLKGLEGNIVKVDRRKGRAKVKLDLYGESFAFDLAFKILERN